MTTSTLCTALLCLLPAMAVCTLGNSEPSVSQDKSAPTAQSSKKDKAMQVHYLEIVTPDMDAMCSSLEKMHGVKFSKPVAEFGNARTATLRGGGQIGVRAPMRDNEDPVVRPYLLVDDIESAINEAEAAGAEIAMPPMEMPNRGKFAIYIQGGIQHGLWQI